MLPRTAKTENRSAARKAFARYLRTGQRLPESEFEPNRLNISRKYNQNHDPRNGQFTFGPGGSASPVRGHGVPSAAGNGFASTRSYGFLRSKGPLKGTGTVRFRVVAAKPGHQPILSRVDIDERASKFEVTARADPGRIGRTVRDPGGPSYGTYQLSSSKGPLGEFIKSPEAAAFSGELKGLRETSPEFDKNGRKLRHVPPIPFKRRRQILSRGHIMTALLRAFWKKPAMM